MFNVSLALTHQPLLSMYVKISLNLNALSEQLVDKKQPFSLSAIPG